MLKLYLTCSPSSPTRRRPPVASLGLLLCLSIQGGCVLSPDQGERSEAAGCELAAERCATSGEGIEACVDVAGLWEAVETCPLGCNEGRCRSAAAPAEDAICPPSQRRCVGDSVERCDWRGERWLFDQACPLGCASAACLEAICDPGVRRCAGAEVEECVENGLRWAFRRGCPTGCEEGHCRVIPPGGCVPGDRRCEGPILEACAEDMAWAPETLCAARCEAGACVCDPNAPERADNGQDDDCDGEVDEAGSLRIAGLVVSEDRRLVPVVELFDGDGNGLLDAGEEASVRLRIVNLVGEAVLGGELRLVSRSPALTVLDGSDLASYPALALGEEGLTEPAFSLRVSEEVEDGSALALDLQVTDSLLGELPSLQYTAVARRVRRLTVQPVVVDDDVIGFSDGNGDGQADGGEDVELRVVLTAGTSLPLGRAGQGLDRLPSDRREQVLRITAQSQSPWLISSEGLEQRWSSVIREQQLTPPAVFFASIELGAPADALACLDLDSRIFEEERLLYRSRELACFRIGGSCGLEDEDRDGVSCTTGDCDDGDDSVARVPDESACDGLDEDCDGWPDDPFGVGQPCEAVGACGLGRLECGDLEGVICSTGPGGSQSRVAREECNGRDDDCDGEVDEARGEGGCGPDLRILPEHTEDDYWIDQAEFDESSCAVVEGCVQGVGLRTLLRFGMSTGNQGTEDLHMGLPREHPDLFQHSPCHDHFHFSDYADYSLETPAGEVVAPGHKQAFCLLDSGRFQEDDPTVREEGQYHCLNQGISRGWYDRYGSGLDCQWIDITDVPGGSYALRLRVNPRQVLDETDYSNNETVVQVELPGSLQLDQPCPEEAPDGLRRPCGWEQVQVAECVPGELLRLGCNGAEACGLGRCEGDPMLRVCPGADAGCFRGSALGQGNDACGEACPVVQITCPVEGQYTVWTAANELGAPYLCELEVGVVDPTMACDDAAAGIGRVCGWEIAEAGFECEPGRRYRVGCNINPGCELGEECEGDPMIRVCAGAGACHDAAALTRNDDACNALCPTAEFECPEQAQVTLMTGAYRSVEAYGCQLEVAPVAEEE